MATHNCATSALWFSPDLFLQAAARNPSYALSNPGAVTRNGTLVQHLQIQRTDVLGGSGLGAALSSMDVFLDAATGLPASFAVAQHPDENALYNVPVEIQFSSYVSVGRVSYPPHIVRFFNGAPNTDIADSDFNF